MSRTADAFQPFFVQGLLGVHGRPKIMTLADLIGRQKRIGFDLDFDDDARAMIADFRDPAPVLNCLASDLSRFASAAFQSVSSIESAFLSREDLAWGLIRAYYAAFYAGHCVLRIFGESCSFFDRAHVSRITDLAKALGRSPKFRLGASAYHCKVDTSAAKVYSYSLREGTGGAHEAFWQVLGRKLRFLNEQILGSTLDAFEPQAVFAQLDGFQRNLTSYGAPLHSWLSVLRNEVQYRHEHQVWLPSDLKRHDRARLARVIGQWTRDPMEIDVGVSRHRPLEEFAAACAFLVALCRALLTRIAEHATRSGRSFARLGPLAVLQDVMTSRVVAAAGETSR